MTLSSETVSSETLSFENQSQTFLHWLTTNGASISSKIKLADYRPQNQGRGVQAVENIQAGEILFSIPRKLVIATDNDYPDFQEFIQAKNLDHLDPWMRLVVLMLFLMSNRSNQHYKPYFDVLPKQFDTLIFWTAKELQLLKGSCIVEKICKEEAEEIYKRDIEPLFENEQGIDASLEAYHLVNSLIMAYSFDIPETEKDQKEEQGEDGFVEDENDGLVKAMVPLADMLNAHTKLCNARLMPSETNEDTLEMIAIADIEAGEQVYNSYGDVPNADLLRRYGYVEQGGTNYELVELKNDALLELVKQEFALSPESVSQMVEILQEWEDGEDTVIYDEDTYELPDSGIPDHTLLLLLLYFQFQPVAVDMKQKKLMRAISRIEQLAPFTAEGKKVWIKLVEKRLTDYDNVEPAATTGVSKHKEFAAQQVVESEKQILRRSLEWANKQKPLDTREILQTLTKKRDNGSGSNDTTASPKKARTQ